MSALAQATRWRIFELLLAAGDRGLLQGEIASALGVTKNLLSSHLRITEAASLVSSERSGREVKNTGRGNMFVVFGEPDVDVIDGGGTTIRVKVNGVDVFDPNTGDIRFSDSKGIAAWFIDTERSDQRLARGVELAQVVRACLGAPRGEGVGERAGQRRLDGPSSGVNFIRDLAP